MSIVFVDSDQSAAHAPCRSAKYPVVIHLTEATPMRMIPIHAATLGLAGAFIVAACGVSNEAVSEPKVVQVQCVNDRCPVPLPGGGSVWVSLAMADFIGCIRNVGLDNVETTISRDVGSGIAGKLLSGDIEASLKSGLTAKAVAKYQTDSGKLAQIEECNRAARAVKTTPACDQYCGAMEKCFPERPKQFCARDCENQVVMAQTVPGCLDAEDSRAACLEGITCEQWRKHIIALDTRGPLGVSECLDGEVNILVACKNTPDADVCRRACTTMTACNDGVDYGDCLLGCGKKFIGDALTRRADCGLAHVSFLNCVTTLECPRISSFRQSGGKLSDPCVLEARAFAEKCVDGGDQDPTRIDLGAWTFLGK